jgi:hypothetical protein
MQLTPISTSLLKSGAQFGEHFEPKGLVSGLSRGLEGSASITEYE